MTVAGLADQLSAQSGSASTSPSPSATPSPATSANPSPSATAPSPSAPAATGAATEAPGAEQIQPLGDGVDAIIFPDSSATAELLVGVPAGSAQPVLTRAARLAALSKFATASLVKAAAKEGTFVDAVWVMDPSDQAVWVSPGGVSPPQQGNGLAGNPQGLPLSLLNRLSRVSGIAVHAGLDVDGPLSEPAARRRLGGDRLRARRTWPGGGRRRAARAVCPRALPGAGPGRLLPAAPGQRHRPGDRRLLGGQQLQHRHPGLHRSAGRGQGAPRAGWQAGQDGARRPGGCRGQHDRGATDPGGRPGGGPALLRLRRHRPRVDPRGTRCRPRTSSPTSPRSRRGSTRR